MSTSDHTTSLAAQSLTTRRGFITASGCICLAAVVASARPHAALADATEGQVGDATPTSVTDMGGTAVELPDAVSSYADTWADHASIDIVLDGAKGLVATPVSRDTHPWMYEMCPNMKNAATIPAHQDASAEAASVADQGPQLAFAKGDALRKALEEQGIPLVDCSFATFDQMAQSIELSAQIIGKGAQVNAQKYTDALTKVLDAVKQQTDTVDESDRPTVLYGPSVATGVVAGAGTIADEWLSAAGAANANTGDAGTADAPCAVEDLAALNPDYILTATPGEAQAIMDSKEWAQTAAVKNKHVYTNPAGASPWGEPGAELLLQVQWAAAVIHPDLFKDFDEEQAVEDFYKEYFNYELDKDQVKLILSAEPPTAQK